MHTNSDMHGNEGGREEGGVRRAKESNGSLLVEVVKAEAKQTG